VFSGPAFAAVYVRWLATPGDAIFDYPEVGALGVPNLMNAVLFLKKQTITGALFNDDTVTVCDGATCMQFKARPILSETWLPKSAPVRDTRAKYKNSSAGFSSSARYVTGSAQPQVTITGHWEWWDHYSNGVYSGSSDLQYVVDSVSYTGSATLINPPNRAYVY
jgi:hypothetical protein